MKPLHDHPFNWLDSLRHTDPAFVEESAPTVTSSTKILRKNPRRRRVTALIAATLAICMLAGVVALCIPYRTTPPSVERYKDSEYYTVIQSINTLSFKAPRYKNGFDSLFHNLFGTLSKAVENGWNDTAAGDAAPPASNAPVPGYAEVTDNQVAGVIESDVFKRTNTHIFYLSADNLTLKAYSIAGAKSALVGSCKITDLYNNRPSTAARPELYISADGLTATVIIPVYGGKSNQVSVYSLDISNPAAMEQIDEAHVTGNYISSRMVDGQLLLISEFLVSDPDFDDESTFVPQIDTGRGFHSIPVEDIEIPEGATHTRYTVVTKLKERNLAPQGAKAFYSYTDDVYVTPENLYLARVFFDYSEPTDVYDSQIYCLRNSMTEIRCLSYAGDTIEPVGSVTVRGYIKDQYSLDEHEEILRVVTTTNAVEVRKEDDTTRFGVVMSSDLQSATGNSNASLYCIDTSTWKVVAEVIDFAPPREEVRSVRFDGDMAYVCTAIEVSDPVFFFDLSDLRNITVKDTGTIEGFSHSLVNFGNGFLLGIGQGAWSGEFKVEVYEETPDGVRSVDAFTIDNSQSTTDYKAYFIDREHGLVGFGIGHKHENYDYEDTGKIQNECYILLRFDGYQFQKLIDIPLEGTPTEKRATLIDGYFYMLSGKDFEVRSINVD